MQVNPANYWRNNKNWSNFIGKTGKVIFVTKTKVASAELKDYAPYCFAIVEMNKKRYEFMSEKNAELKKGDKVRLVLRRTSDQSKSSLINYGIKIVKF